MVLVGQRKKRESTQPYQTMSTQVHNYPKDPSSITGQIWATADAIASKEGGKTSVTRAAVLASCADLEKGTISTQYQRWRVHHGLATLRGPKSDKPAPKKKAVKKTATKKKVVKKAAAKKKAAKKS